MKLALLVAAAVAIFTSIAAPVDAATYGTIPVGTAANDGLTTIYGSNAPRGGYFNGNLYLTGTANIQITYLGSEAGFNNVFKWAGSNLFSTGGSSNIFNNAGVVASQTFNNVIGGLLNFAFLANGTGVNANGSNAVGNPNFFVSFDANPVNTSGQSLVLWFDDKGAGADRDYDDMAIRLEIVGGTVSTVPVPAAGLLLLGGLGALGALKRRRKTA